MKINLRNINTTILKYDYVCYSPKKPFVAQCVPYNTASKPKNNKNQIYTSPFQNYFNLPASFSSFNVPDKYVGFEKKCILGLKPMEECKISKYFKENPSINE